MDSLECEGLVYGSRNGHLYRRDGFYIYYQHRQVPEENDLWKKRKKNFTGKWMWKGREAKTGSASKRRGSGKHRQTWKKRRTIMKVQEYTEVFTAGGYNRKPGGRRPGKDPRMQLQFCWGGCVRAWCDRISES